MFPYLLVALTETKHTWKGHKNPQILIFHGAMGALKEEQVGVPRFPWTADHFYMIQKETVCNQVKLSWLKHANIWRNVPVCSVKLSVK